jgi:N,N'-diacetyllegionaminate synthase
MSRSRRPSRPPVGTVTDPERADVRRAEFAIGARLIGQGQPCLIVGEVAQAHEGSLGMAHAFIDAIADAGADAVKFQTHIAAAESTPAETFRTPFSQQDASRYAYWRRMEFTCEQWSGLLRHAEARGLIFLSSPFSNEAVKVLLACGVKAWKVASGEIAHFPLLENVARTKKPVILSTGMASWYEIHRAVELVQSMGAPVAVLQCTSKYPTPPEEVGVEVIPALHRAFGCAVGLSDHSGTVFPGIVAAAIGANVVEVHVTLSREMFGPDVAASVSTPELRQLVRGVRFVERMRVHPPDKDLLARELAPVRAAFFRSIVASRALRAGTVLGAADLALKKPGTGLPPDKMAEVLGRTVVRDLPVDTQIRAEDLLPAAPRPGVGNDGPGVAAAALTGQGDLKEDLQWARDECALSS